MTFRLLPGELFVTLDDDITISRIEFHEQSVTARLFARDQRSAAAAEQIQNVLSGPRRVGQRPDGQLNRFFGEMNHRHRVDLLDMPEIRLIVGPEIAVGRTFTPTVEADLEGTHEVLAS